MGEGSGGPGLMTFVWMPAVLGLQVAHSGHESHILVGTNMSLGSSALSFLIPAFVSILDSAVAAITALLFGSFA